MVYQINEYEGKSHYFTEMQNCCRIPYLTSREISKRFPDKNFVIIGEVGGFSRASADCDFIYLEEGKLLPILPRGSMKTPFEWVIGYAEVEGDRYVAVIGGVFHLFMVIKCIFKKKKCKK